MFIAHNSVLRKELCCDTVPKQYGGNDFCSALDPYCSTLAVARGNKLLIFPNSEKRYKIDRFATNEIQSHSFHLSSINEEFTCLAWCGFKVPLSFPTLSRNKQGNTDDPVKTKSSSRIINGETDSGIVLGWAEEIDNTPSHSSISHPSANLDRALHNYLSFKTHCTATTKNINCGQPASHIVIHLLLAGTSHGYIHIHDDNGSLVVRQHVAPRPLLSIQMSKRRDIFASNLSTKCGRVRKEEDVTLTFPDEIARIDSSEILHSFLLHYPENVAIKEEQSFISSSFSPSSPFPLAPSFPSPHRHPMKIRKWILSWGVKARSDVICLGRRPISLNRQLAQHLQRKYFEKPPPAFVSPSDASLLDPDPRSLDLVPNSFTSPLIGMTSLSPDDGKEKRKNAEKETERNRDKEGDKGEKEEEEGKEEEEEVKEEEEDEKGEEEDEEEEEKKEVLLFLVAGEDPALATLWVDEKSEGSTLTLLSEMAVVAAVGVWNVTARAAAATTAAAAAAAKDPRGAVMAGLSYLAKGGSGWAFSLSSRAASSFGFRSKAQSKEREGKGEKFSEADSRSAEDLEGLDLEPSRREGSGFGGFQDFDENGMDRNSHSKAKQSCERNKGKVPILSPRPVVRRHTPDESSYSLNGSHGSKSSAAAVSPPPPPPSGTLTSAAVYRDKSRRVVRIYAAPPYPFSGVEGFAGATFDCDKGKDMSDDEETCSNTRKKSIAAPPVAACIDCLGRVLLVEGAERIVTHVWKVGWTIVVRCLIR